MPALFNLLFLFYQVAIIQMPCFWNKSSLIGSSFQAAPLPGLVVMAVVVVVRMAVAIVVVFVMAAVVPNGVAVVVVIVVPRGGVVGIVPVGVAVVPAVIRARVPTMKPVSVVIPSSTGAYKAMMSPAVGIAPIGPRADAEKDSVIEVARSIEARRGAGVRRKLVIAVGADGRSADLHAE